jgi:glycosidase
MVGNAYEMNETPDSTRWWITLHHLVPQQQYAYQYLVDGTITIADPYTEEILDPNNDPYISSTVYPGLKPYPAGASGIVSILETARPAHVWTTTGYTKPDKKNLVVYELLIRDFLASHNYHDLIDTLNYLQNLGINAIELMPVNEFEGNISWGYNPDFYFAPDKYYGPSDSLKAFIDKCHSRNIAVIMDFVLNHSFGSSPMCQLYWDAANAWPSADNPWFNTDCDPSTPGYQGKHPDGVGYDVNHESPYTKKFFTDAVRHWVANYHVDGYRFDLAKGYTQFYSGSDLSLWGNYDASRIAIWEGYADSIWAQDPSTYVILEHFADNDEQTVLANYGMMLWGNMSYGYQQSSMGYATSGGDLTGISYQALGWSLPGLVGYMESHDEERVMYKNEQYGAASGGYNVKDLDVGLDRIKLNAVFFFTIPGPKMISEFEELGYDTSITADGGNTSPKPILWNYTAVPERAAVYNTFRQLIYLKTQLPLAFNTSSFTLNVGSYNLRSIYLNDASMQAVVIGNFDVNTGTIGVNFQHTGWWYEYFTGDSINISVPSTTATNITLNPGEYRIYTSSRITPPAPALDVKTTTAQNDEVHLYQNFPNPFRGATVVDFHLPASMRAHLEIYDAIGNSVDVVTDADYKAGNYTFNINGKNLRSGTYFLTLTTSSGSKQTISFSVLN